MFIDQWNYTYLYLVFTKLTDLTVCTFYKNRSFINIIDWNDFVHTAQQCRQGVCVSQYCTCCFNDTLNRSLGVSVTHNTWCGDNTLPSSVGVSPSTCSWKDTLHSCVGVSPSTCSWCLWRPPCSAGTPPCPHCHWTRPGTAASVLSGLLYMVGSCLNIFHFPA